MIVFMDGFDFHSVDGSSLEEKWTARNNSFGANSYENGEGRFGGGAVRLNMISPGLSEFRVTVPSSGEFIYNLSMNVKDFNGVTNYVTIFTLHDVNTKVGDFVINVDRTLGFRNAAGTTQVNSSFAIQENSYFHIELRVDAADGEVELRVFEQTWIPTTSITLGSSAITSIDFNLEENQTNIPGGFVLIDDVVIIDTATAPNNTFIGDVKIETIRPFADGTVTDFTPITGGDNYDEIDDIARDEDATFNESNTVGHRDLFTAEDLADTPTAIFAVQESVNMRKTGAGTRTVTGHIRSGVTDYDHGTPFALSSDYLYGMFIWETDPDTSLAWTKAGVDAAEFGYKVSS